MTKDLIRMAVNYAFSPARHETASRTVSCGRCGSTMLSKKRDSRKRSTKAVSISIYLPGTPQVTVSSSVWPSESEPLTVKVASPFTIVSDAVPELRGAGRSVSIT